jgi:hypothetical protein
MSRVGLASGVVVEELGGDLMVMVPGSTEVLTLSGDAAESVRLVQSGSRVATDAVVSDLLRLGVFETSGLSRRGLIKAGAIGAGAGIAVMAMPGVAAASSGSTSGSSGYQPPVGAQVLDATSEWGKRDSVSSTASFQTGTSYYFGLFLNNSFPPSEDPPVLRFKGFTDELLGLTNTSDLEWEFFVEFFTPIADLSAPLQAFLLGEEGSYPPPRFNDPPEYVLDGVLFVDWGGVTYALEDVRWF